jgi:hypothetical protein
VHNAPRFNNPESNTVDCHDVYSTQRHTIDVEHHSFGFISSEIPAGWNSVGYKKETMFMSISMHNQSHYAP